MSPKTLLLALLAALAVAFVAFWRTRVLRARSRGLDADPATDAGLPGAFETAVGAITNFLDALGIGSFATTTSIFRLRGTVPDRLLPGTLNVGHALPTFAQAFIYVQIIEVEFRTLIALIAASVAGAWLGAGVVSRWPKRNVQLGMGLALLVAAALILARLAGLLPAGGDSLGLSGARLAAGIAGSFVFGALMTIGVGAYAPIMILVALLGMNPTTAFPIMMGSCAFLMPVASLRFIRENAYALRAAIGLALGGIPGVIVAATLVKSLPLDAVRWLVVIVVVYTAVTLLHAGARPEALRRSALPE